MHATTDRPSKARWAVRPLSLAVLGLVASHAAEAADPVAGKQKAGEVCRTCHGLDGISKTPDAPHIAGHPAQYLEPQLGAFRSGARQHEVMSIIAQGLNDGDIANLAAWYSEKISAHAPP